MSLLAETRARFGGHRGAVLGTGILLAVASLMVAACKMNPPVAARPTATVPTSATTKAVAAATAPLSRDARMAWWREARFGMFIHWGVYSVPGGVWNGKRIGGGGEWILHEGKIPVADYVAIAPQFNPVDFNAEQWVLIAKNAGMKYIVITAKHHDGFAMYHSAVDGFNIVDATPFKRDPLAELAAACKKHGIKLGLYYSQAQDWTAPGGASMGGHWDPAQNGDMAKYIQTKAIPQVREILSNYGPISILWWDTSVGMTKEMAAPLDALAKSLQPNIITNDRLGPGFRGDTETPEQSIPATGLPGRDWETCMTMNGTWGYKSYDNNWKSTSTLVRNLIDIASKGGNYLLNVGPTSSGEIPQPSVERLAAMGEWMKRNGAAIYGTTASPFKRNSFDGRCTVKGNTLYVHVFKWSADGIKIETLRTKVVSATFLATGEKAEVGELGGDKGISIKSPAAPDPIATVVELKLAGPIQTE